MGQAHSAERLADMGRQEPGRAGVGLEFTGEFVGGAMTANPRIAFVGDHDVLHEFADARRDFKLAAPTGKFDHSALLMVPRSVPDVVPYCLASGPEERRR